MKHIDKLFKEKLYNHETVVPEGMWEKIAPIAEEESGRAILWFWFAGILALLLGGFGIYKMVSTSNANPTVPGTLVFENEVPEQSLDLVDNSLTTETSTLKEKELSIDESKAATKEVEEIKSKNNTAVKTEKVTAVVKSSKSKSVPVLNKQSTELNNTTQSITYRPQSISNTVETITTAVGTPANLVITKSYINSEGSVIKQSNLTDKSGKEDPVYDVILNSEAKDLNVGALLRIIEPLEIIPLPAFQKELKKKTLSTIL